MSFYIGSCRLIKLLCDFKFIFHLRLFFTSKLNNGGLDISDFGIPFENCLPKLTNHRDMVFRCVKEEYCDVERYAEAKDNKMILTEYNFISASKFQIIARGFGRILFRIYPKTAKDVEKISKSLSANAMPSSLLPIRINFQWACVDFHLIFVKKPLK